jgi:hypothetical protein
MEIDFFTLSIFIIFKNLNIFNLNLLLRKIIIIYLFKLYNWK